MALKYRPIMKRIRDRGWPIEQAFAVPVGSIHRRPSYDLILRLKDRLSGSKSGSNKVTASRVADLCARTQDRLRRKPRQLATWPN